MNEAEVPVVAFTSETGDETSEIERLREEVRHLRGLLSLTAADEDILVSAERRAQEQKLELATTRDALDQAARLFDTVLSSIVDFAYAFDRDGRFTYVNQALLDLWQIKLEKAVGKNFFDLNYPDELATRLQQQIEAVYVSGQMVKDETPYTSPAGVTRYYEYIFVPVFNKSGSVDVVAGSTRDITERYEVEGALQASEEQIRDILESITDGFFALDRDWRFNYTNRQAEKILEREAGDLIGKVIWEEYPGLVGSRFEKAYRDAGERGLASSLTEFYPDHERWYAVHVFPSPNGVSIYFRNVTELKLSEKALEENEQKFRLVTESMPQLVWSTLPDGYHDYYNARWFEYTGLTFEDTKGEKWNDVLHPDDQQRAWSVWRHSLETGEPYEIEYRFKRHDGVYRWFIGRALALRDAEGRVTRWFGTCTDVDDQKQTESTLRAQQKEIESLNARLQRAMTETHHRVKNNLQLVSALIDLQRSGDHESVPVAELSRLGANVRALGVIHDILTTEAKEGSEQESLSARAVLEKLIDVLRQTTGGRKLLSELDDVRLTGRQTTTLALVTNELVSNALKHGRGETEVRFKVGQEAASLEVCDDGPGFSAGFTAETARNTGLELVENIVAWDLRGEIAYENRQEGGARIRVSFPIKTN